MFIYLKLGGSCERGVVAGWFFRGWVDVVVFSGGSGSFLGFLVN